MTPTSVTATTSASQPVPATSAAPEATPVSADFLALLLTIGVGTPTSQSESDPSGQPADAPEPAHDAATPDATTLGTTASVALAATLSMIAPALPPMPAAPIVEPAAPRGNEPAPTTVIGVAADAIAAATADPSTTTSTTAASDRAEPATTKPGSPVTPEAQHALADLHAGTIDPGAAQEIAAAATAVPTPPATTDKGARNASAARPTAKESDVRAADGGPNAAGSTTATTPVTPAARPEATASAAPKPESSRKPEGGERNATPAVKPEAIGHGTDVVALHAHAEIAPRAVTVDGTATVAATQAPVAPQEAQVVADQVVRAAKLVVDDGLAQMRVDLQPPTLGGVRVEADVRGEVVVLTITAERPETQALLTQALPDIQQALVRRDVGQATVAIIGSTATPLSSDGRRAPERRPETPRERPTSHPAERRRTLRASRGVSAVDITV